MDATLPSPISIVKYSSSPYPLSSAGRDPGQIGRFYPRSGSGTARSLRAVDGFDDEVLRRRHIGDLQLGCILIYSLDRSSPQEHNLRQLVPPQPEGVDPHRPSGGIKDLVSTQVPVPVDLAGRIQTWFQSPCRQDAPRLYPGCNIRT